MAWRPRRRHPPASSIIIPWKIYLAALLEDDDPHRESGVVHQRVEGGLAPGPLAPTCSCRAPGLTGTTPTGPAGSPEPGGHAPGERPSC
jgi:hypothetical protein